MTKNNLKVVKSTKDQELDIKEKKHNHFFNINFNFMHWFIHLYSKTTYTKRR